MTNTLCLLLAAVGQAPSGFEVRTLAGEPVTGNLTTLGADGSLAVGDKTVRGGDWYSVRRAGRPLPPWPRAPHAELTNGDRVAGKVVEADGDALRMAVGGDLNQTVRFPLSALRAVWLTARPADDADPAWLSAPRKRDLFLARNGDTAAGGLTKVDPAANAVTFQADGKDRTLEWSKLAAIGFNADLARVRRPKGPFYRLTFADGTRLSAQGVTFDGRTWTVATLFKDSVHLPADQLVSLDVEQGKVIYLSDLKPAKYQYQTFDGEQFAWAADRCVTGRPIVLNTLAGDATFDRGVGLHADCTISYTLGGRYRRFEAIAGLDAKSGIRGNAVLGASVDGKEHGLPDNGRLTDAGGPVTIRLDVSGAKELTITVRQAGGGNVQDHVDLAEARLVP